MRIKILSLACLVWLVSFTAVACEYADDPRLSKEQLPELVQALVAGQPVPPVRIRVGTYLQMGEKSRHLLEPHLAMFDANCAPVGFFEGELLGRAVIPFEEIYRVMAQAIHDDRPNVAKQLFANARAAPISVAQMQKLFSLLPYSGSHGLQVRERMQEVFPQFTRQLPLDKELADPLKDGRPQDYAMFKLFQIFGGRLLLDQQCGPYRLDESFYSTERVKGLLGEHDVQIVRREPFLHMMRAMGHSVSKVDAISYRIINCN